MASKFKRGKTWYVRYKDVDGLWKNISCGPEATASDAEFIRNTWAAKEMNARHKAPVRKVDVELFAAFEEFRKNILPRSDIGRVKVRRSIRREQVVIENFVKWAKVNSVFDIHDLTEHKMREYFDHLEEKKKSARTRHEERRVLAKFFKHAIAENFCSFNPISKIPNPKPSIKRPRFFSESELKDIFGAAKQPYNRIFRFLYFTGLRIGELGNLEWTDILEPQALAVIRVMEGNKTKREETIPLSTGALQVISEQRSQLSESSTADAKRFVFTNAERLKLDNDNIYRNLKRVMIEKKISGASPHTFRHTCASHLVIKGVSLYVVKEILRHASIEETEIYAHLSKEAIRTAIEKLSF